MKKQERRIPEFPMPEKEPLCRVGVVLESDNKNRMDIVLPAADYIIKGNGNSTRIPGTATHSLSLEVGDGQVRCISPSGQVLLITTHHITIELDEGVEQLAPQSGILLKGCVTGRGFHWQKEVDLFYPYMLEFHEHNGKLIVVNIVPLEAYLACVVTSEMSAACPPAFIQAQATAARSWMLINLKDKHTGMPFTICNDDCCQRYQGATFLSPAVAQSVSLCSGMFLVTESGNVCDAYYSKCCGGIIEKGSNVFGKSAEGLSESTDAPVNSTTKQFNPVTDDTIREWVTGAWVKKTDSFCSPNVCSEKDLPKYLGAVDESGSYYRWKIVYTHAELVDYLRKKEGIKDIQKFIDFRAGKRGNSGRLHDLMIVYSDAAGNEKTHTIKTQYQIRNALHEKFLFSSAFVWDYERDKEGQITSVILQGAGWGHGTGLCQMGALGMSLQGYSYEDILKHYYDKTTLQKAY